MNPGYQNPDAVHRTGPVDTDVSVISVQTRSGQPLAVLGNYSTHYAGAPAISADYFGVFCQRIAQLLATEGAPPSFVAIMSNGTSGDANCCDFVNPPRKFDRHTVGEDVAQAAWEAYQNIAYFDWVPIVMSERMLTLQVRLPNREEVRAASEFLRDKDLDPPRSVEEVYARETMILDASPAERHLKLQAIRLGELAITAMPNEAYGTTGLAIKRDSPLQPTLNISMANGYFGYIPPPDQFPLGGYTTWRARSSCLEVQAEPKIRAALLQLLTLVAGERSEAVTVESPDG